MLRRIFALRVRQRARSLRQREQRLRQRRDLFRGMEPLEARLLLADCSDITDIVGYRDFRRLAADEIACLSTAQVSTIPDSYWLGRIPSDPRAALNTQQVQALNVSSTGIDKLTDEQVADLTIPQIQSLDYRQFRYLSAAQTPHLTVTQMGAIPDSYWFGRISTDARAALTGDQIRALNVANIGLDKLTAEQVAELSISQIQSVDYRQFRYLSAAQTPHLTVTQMGAIPDSYWFGRISTDARAALIADQIRALNVANIGLDKLTAEQVAELSISQIQSVDYRQFRYLNATQTPHLTTDQVSTIPDSYWFGRISTDARAALTGDQIRALNVANIGLDKLTAEQVAELSISQIQSVDYRQFRYLNATQTPHLTTDQVSTIPDSYWFGRMSADARAALTGDQVRALNVANIGADKLTESQLAQLTAAQVQSLDYRYFRYLGASQVSQLTNDQLASIPNGYWFERISEAARALLSNSQVQSLNTGEVSIGALTPRQRAALTAAQVQALSYHDLRYLNADQAIHISNAQLASVPNQWYFQRMSEEVRAVLSRDQLLSLDDGVMTSMVGLPSSFAVSQDEHEHNTSGPHGDDPVKQHEHMAVFELVPHDAATAVTLQSGDWSDPQTWVGGQVPGRDAKVLIRGEHQVVFDAIITPSQAVHTVRVDGLLSFAPDQQTQLAADTIIVDPEGRLHIGTDARPIDDNVTARIVFADRGEIDLAWDPNQFSRGLVSHGEVRMHGETVTPYGALAIDPLRGDTQLVMEQVPENWQVGDRLVLTGTQANYDRNQDEELEIVAIAGNVVQIDADSTRPGIQALAYHHVTPDGDDVRSLDDPGNISPVGDLLKVYVANMNRNVVLISENPAINSHRGHVMFMHHGNVEVDNAGFYGLGRSDKRNPANDPVFDEHGQLIDKTGLNPRGRYAVHVHRTGTSYDGHPVWIGGSAVVDSPGWGFVNHDSYVNMHDNVAFHVVGAGFVTELGNEIGSMVGNLSINNSGSGHGLEAREDIFDFGHGGHGFWLQGPLVEVRDNISAGSREGAFVFFTQSSQARINAEQLADPSLAAGRHSVPVGSVPLKSVENNVAFASRRGLETWFHQTHMNDGQSYIVGFQSWNQRGEGIFTPYTGRTTIQDATLVGNLRRPGGTAIGRNNVTNQMAYRNVTALGYEVGISVPVNRDTTIVDGRFAAVRAIQVDRAHDNLREVDIVGDPQFETLSDSQLRGREQFDLYLNGGFQMDNFDLETLFTPDIIRLGTIRFNDHQVFYVEQAADFVPFRAGEVPDFVPAELIDLTNSELHEQFGLALAGAIAHPDAQQVSRINGLVGPRVSYPDPLQMKSRKYANQLRDHVLIYIDGNGDRVEETVNLREGWNLLTRNIGDEPRTFFVFGDTQAPEFRLRGEPVVNPNGLRFGITIRGTILDNSFGHKSFQRKFTDLETRPRVTVDGKEYIALDFQIEDLAGNRTDVRVLVLLDENAPLVPGTGQADLPEREMPITLLELLQFYIIT